MNNVTPKQGQVWECTKPMMHFNIGDELNLGGGITDFHTWLQKHFKFVPQNDLEWLAVKCDKWKEGANFLTKESQLGDCGQHIFFEGEFWKSKELAMEGAVTRQEHQNMRYELGLDEKPIPREVFEFMDREYIKEVAKRFNPSPSKRKVYPGPSPLNYPIARCYDDTVKLAEKLFMAHNKKETKMIDLSKAKVGDDYEDEKGNVFEVTANGPINVVVKSPHDGGFFIVNHDGSFFGLTSLRLVAKHDHRTDEEKAIDDLIKPALIFAASSGSYQKDAEKFLNVIKADEIHGVKWVVE